MKNERTHNKVTHLIFTIRLVALCLQLAFVLILGFQIDVVTNGQFFRKISKPIEWAKKRQQKWQKIIIKLWKKIRQKKKYATFNGCFRYMSFNLLSLGVGLSLQSDVSLILNQYNSCVRNDCLIWERIYWIGTIKLLARIGQSGW